MARNGKTQVKLEERVLEFSFVILQVQYNKYGRFYLQLSIQNTHRRDLLSKTSVEVNHSGTQLSTHRIKTDTIPWDENSSTSTYKENTFKFRLPKGFCKNDGKYDVYLLIEVLRLPLQNGNAKGRLPKPEKIGEAKFAIYPRTEIPRANLFAKKGEDYYKYTGVLTLLRPLSRASISMHCGRLTYEVAFHEFVEPGFLPVASDDEEVPISPVSDEPSVEKEKKKPVPVTKKTSKQNILKETNKQYPKSPEHPSNLLEKVKSVDRTTQWTPQEMSDLTSDPLMQEGSFHLLPETPEAENTYSSFNIERTLDSPAIVNDPIPRPSSSQRLLSPEEPTFSGIRSPTMTSPAIDESRIDRHVAKPGYEEIYIIMHGATSLPSLSTGQDPLPFVTLKSIADERGVRKAQSATHATLQPTHAPTWEEIITMEVEESSADEEEVIMTISDSPSKEKLVTYRIPVKDLVPFHPYHFELILPTKEITSGIRAYATIQRRRSHLPRLRNFGFCGLEVVLLRFHRKLSTPVGPLLAVARIVPDYAIYKSKMLSRHAAGITTTSVTFPSPHPVSFEVSGETMQGYPQVTTSSTGNNTPAWEHSFMFSANDIATMFTHNSALVVEYYASTSTMSALTWTIRSPIGYSTFLLDDGVFQALTSEAGRLGVRVDDLLIQGSQLETLEGADPSVDLILRLINTERPDSLATAAVSHLLPSMDAMPIPGSAFNPILSSGKLNPSMVESDGGTALEDTAPPTPRQAPPVRPLRNEKTQIVVNENEYPPADILQTILPEYVTQEYDVADEYVQKQEKSRKGPTKARQQTYAPEDNNTMSLVSHQAKQIQNYSEAVKKMGGDLLTLRQDVAKLQIQNHDLRRELMMNQEMSDIVRGDISSGVVSSEEVVDKYVAAKSKLSEESDMLKKYKAKVQQLQNLLIKANEREKKYLSDRRTTKSTEETLSQAQDKLSKLKSLEETCVQQERVIEKMEKLLAKYTVGRVRKQQGDSRRNIYPSQNTAENESASQQISSLLTQENARLRMELENAKLQAARGEAEKSQLAAKLERAENRISSLESQLDYNARLWAKERHDLNVRMQERKNGF